MILQRIICELKRSDHIVLIGIQIISPPLKHQTALVKVLGLMGMAVLKLLLSL